MATSGSANWGLNRDEVITLALRRINAVAQGETPTATAISEAAVALNALVKEWEADGMPLWKISTFNFAPTANTSSYQITVGGTVNRYPPLKILQAWYRNTSVTPNTDTPINLITRSDYNLLTPKATTAGVISQLYYDVPGNQGQTSQQPLGTVYVWNTPNASFASSNQIYCVGQFPYEDFDSSTDYPDFPPNWNNALAWNLAVDLAPEYGVPLGNVAQMTKRADRAKANALMNGPEEGSLYIQPSYYGRR